MPTRLCAEPGCPKPSASRGRCATHARITNKAIPRAGKRIYNTKRWQILRRRVLFEQPLCACGCGDIATDVDHIVAIEDGGDPWARTNLQGLTGPCHSRKTRAEQLAR